MLFHKNRNTQIQVYTIQHLVLETGKTCEACSTYTSMYLYLEICKFVLKRK